MTERLSIAQVGSRVALGFRGGTGGEKNLPANAGDIEIQVWPLGGEDPLEEGMATHPSILAWEIHGQRSLVGYSPWGCKELDMTEVA